MAEAEDLQRFVDAQEAGRTYDSALAELRAGRKRTHWMWFVFPQLRGLGRTSTAHHYGISGRDEARAYVDDPVLGQRLVACAQALLDLPGSDASAVLDGDDVKLRSSMTLFTEVAPEQPVFAAVLDKYFGGRTDPATVDRL